MPSHLSEPYMVVIKVISKFNILLFLHDTGRGFPKSVQAILNLYKHMLMWMHHDWVNSRLFRPILTPFSILPVANSPVTPKVTSQR